MERFHYMYIHTHLYRHFFLYMQINKYISTERWRQTLYLAKRYTRLSNYKLSWIILNFHRPDRNLNAANYIQTDKPENIEINFLWLQNHLHSITLGVTRC